MLCPGWVNTRILESERNRKEAPRPDPGELAPQFELMRKMVEQMVRSGLDPKEVGAPSFMRIDFAKKLIVGPIRSSPITAMGKDFHQILLQGTELGMAWSMALDSATGKMVTTFSSRDGAYVLFGSCTPL